MDWLDEVYAHRIIDAKEGGAHDALGTSNGEPTLTLTVDTTDPDNTVLVWLDAERIFNVTPAENGLLFEESCDNNFRLTLTPAAVRQLCRELEALAAAIEEKRTASIPPDTEPA